MNDELYSALQKSGTSKDIKYLKSLTRVAVSNTVFKYKNEKLCQ